MISTFFSATSFQPHFFHARWSDSVPRHPVGCGDLEAGAVSLLSAAGISSRTSFIQFVGAAYCRQSKVKDCSYGCKFSLFLFLIVINVSKFGVSDHLPLCSALPGSQPTLTGRGGNFWPQQSSAIVSHQGTDPTKL